MELKILYEDNNILAVDKPAGLPVFPAQGASKATIADCLLEIRPELNKMDPPRYGIAHRLDKDTSGVLLVAKNPESLIFLQKQFINRSIQKRYLALVNGNIKEEIGVIETLIGRGQKDKRKQEAYFSAGPKSENKRQAITEYKVAERYQNKNDFFTLLEVSPKTGRKHQIRCHLAYIQHPIIGDKLYGFKRQPLLPDLSRQFLHASAIKFKNYEGKIIEIKSELPNDLQKILNNLKTYE